MTAKQSKRILAIHDLSGFGHTSLMAVIPIMYRLGIRICALPTALLSANTDYPDPCWVDLSPQLEPFSRHWQELGLRFDAISSGFLSSAEQAAQVKEVILRLQHENTTVLVDPVMGDNGSLYGCFDAGIVDAMLELVSLADVVTPNFTEAALLAGADPKSSPGASDILAWCRKISASGPRHVIITSVPGSKAGSLEVQYYEAGATDLVRYPFATESGAHPGAGDCFSAFVLAGIVNGCGIRKAIQAAVEIMTRAISLGISPGSDCREGISLEQVLQWDLPRYYHK